MKKVLSVVLCLVLMVPVMTMIACAAPAEFAQGGLVGDGTVVGDGDGDGTGGGTGGSGSTGDPSGVDGDGNVWDFFSKLLAGANWVEIFATIISSLGTILKIFTSLTGGATKAVA